LGGCCCLVGELGAMATATGIRSNSQSGLREKSTLSVGTQYRHTGRALNTGLGVWFLIGSFYALVRVLERILQKTSARVAIGTLEHQVEDGR